MTVRQPDQERPPPPPWKPSPAPNVPRRRTARAIPGTTHGTVANLSYLARRILQPIPLYSLSLSIPLLGFPHEPSFQSFRRHRECLARRHPVSGELRSEHAALLAGASKPKPNRPARLRKRGRDLA